MLVRVLMRCGAPAIARPVTRSIVLPFRSYATPGRPKSVVGEPSRPVKRGVKKAAAKPANGSSAAEGKVAAKRTAAAKKSKKTAQKKKVLTEEQAAALKERQARAKARQQARNEKDKLAELKKIALSAPKAVTDNPYAYFTREKNKAMGKLGGESRTIDAARADFAVRTAAIGSEWTSMNASDREHYNHLSRTAAEAARAEYKRWVESHSPEEIRIANNARRQLAKRLSSGKNKTKGSAWPLIKDDRKVKGAVAPFIQFAINRHASGDLRHIAITERLRLISQEWKDLDHSEKQKYIQLYEQDKARWEAEYLDAYGSPPPSTRSATSSKSAAPAEAAA